MSPERSVHSVKKSFEQSLCSKLDEYGQNVTGQRNEFLKSKKPRQNFGREVGNRKGTYFVSPPSDAVDKADSLSEVRSNPHHHEVSRQWQVQEALSMPFGA